MAQVGFTKQIDCLFIVAHSFMSSEDYILFHVRNHMAEGEVRGTKMDIKIYVKSALASLQMQRIEGPNGPTPSALFQSLISTEQTGCQTTLSRRAEESCARNDLEHN